MTLNSLRIAYAVTRKAATCSWKSRHPSVSPVKMLVSLPVSAAKLKSCPSDTFILLQGFPTSASTENAWARELRACIFTKIPVLLHLECPCQRCPAQVSVSELIQKRQQLRPRELLFTHGGSVTLRNGYSALPRVLPDPKPWLLARLSSSLYYFPFQPPCPVPCLPFLSHGRLLFLVPLCTSPGGREKRSAYSSSEARAANASMIRRKRHLWTVKDSDLCNQRSFLLEFGQGTARGRFYMQVYLDPRTSLNSS